MTFGSTATPGWEYYPWWNEPTTPPQWTWNINTNIWITCPQCGKLVQIGSAYCPSCGAKMIVEVTEKDKLDLILEKLDEILKELQNWR